LCATLLRTKILGPTLFPPSEREPFDPTNLDRDFTARPAGTREDYWSTAIYYYQNTSDRPLHDSL